jgi:hypothetical protein
MDGPEDEQSCYAILGVDPAATSSEIRQAWAILSVGSPTAFPGFKLTSFAVHLNIFDAKTIQNI